MLFNSLNTKLLRDSETVLFPGSQNMSTKMMTFEFLLQGYSQVRQKKSSVCCFRVYTSACESVSKILPDDFSQKVADKVLEGVLKSSQELSEQID